MIDVLRALRFVLALALRTSRSRMALALVLLAVGSVSGPLTAVGLKHLTNDALRGDTHGAAIAGVVSALLSMFALTFAGLSHHLYFRISQRLQVWFDLQLAELANGTPSMAHFDNSGFADRMELVRQDGSIMWNALDQILATLGNVAAVVTAGIVLARTEPLLLLLPLFAVPPLIGGRRATRHVERVRLEEAESIRRARHLFGLAIDPGAGNELRLFGLTDEVHRRHEDLWERTSARLVRAQLHSSWYVLAGQLAFAAGYAGALFLVVHNTIHGNATIGDAVLVATVASQVNQQIGAAVATASQLQRIARAVERMTWLRKFVGDDTSAAAGRTTIPARLSRGISFRGVSFRYPGAVSDALTDVDLHLAPGTVVAIVGENGAGKTTLVKLLCRFYEPTRGAILVDDVPLPDLAVADWRRSIAATFQDFQRYELLVRENVGVGRLESLDDAEAVVRALGDADALNVPRALARGLDTQLGVRWCDGVGLSAGQWQKLALARAMMRRNPLVLVLDEPAAALDAYTEHALFERYAASTRHVSAATGAISVFTSHRFSTVRMADVIVVIDDGCVIECGSHSDLVAAGGLYAELFALQEAAYR